MAHDSALQKQLQRIGDLIEQLESTADPNARAMAKELLESLMAFHGAALERILELAFEAGETAELLIRKCGCDELVSSLFLLYGLHPDDLTSRVTRALEKSQPFLESHGARAELVSIGGDGTVSVRLHLKPNGCGSSAASVKSNLEAAILNAAPDATSIAIEETGGTSQSGFVPLVQISTMGYGGKRAGIPGSIGE